MQIMEGDLARTLERRLLLLRHLDRIGYRGLGGCEYRPRAGTAAGLGWMEEFRRG